ncbi:ABC transporter ATP-binding protein [uncultured Roseobacter sp.]|uniref:ABC transporter ATP-binding protein n=1 Tax=uncultured Roseobacter sp. TaxID=114847 RepID=UPI00260B355B|nr:ABC transporter ATP-binding protein [uncultured Roseobacter sp.]
MADLTLENVEKHYGDVQAVRGVSLHVESGNFVVLVGPSGCGKSTLLRAIAGLEGVSSGTIRIGDRDVTNLAPRQRDIAMVFQSYALYPYLSVYENIAFGLRARKVAAAEVDERVHWAADMLSIGSFLDRHPRELSGGQRQRVAIGRAIVREASLYLFDEPLSNLDAKLRDGMREELKRLHSEIGRTFVYVTHDQIEAMTLADRIVLLNNGVIEQDGPPLDLFERPNNRFVAGFLGSPPMNMLDVAVQGDDRSIRLADGQHLRADNASLPAHDGACVWGIRPEHVTLSNGDEPSVEGVVDVVQPTGSRLFASVAVSGQHLTAELDAHADIRVGRPITLSVAIDRTVFFDLGGRRLNQG